MTNGQKTQVTTLERNVDDTFLLTHEGRTHLVQTEFAEVEEAIAYVAAYLQVDYMWAQHVTNDNLWIAIGVEE